VDAATNVHVKLVDSLKEAQTSINNTILSNKPDLSSVTTEIRSPLQAQVTKIDNQQAKLETFTTLVNGQGTQIQELKNLVQAIPTSTPAPSFTSKDRKTLTNHSNILTSQASLLATICSTLQQLLTATKQTPAVAEGERAAAADQQTPSSSVFQ